MFNRIPTFLKSSYSYDVEQRCSQYVFSEEYTYDSDLLFDECLSASNFEKGGPSHALFEHARSARGDFPGSRYAAADLGAQVRLKQLLDRAAHAFAIR
jgi:hypothetical protein